MIRWTGLAPREFGFPFPGSLASTFLGAGGGIPTLNSSAVRRYICIDIYLFLYVYCIYNTDICILSLSLTLSICLCLCLYLSLSLPPSLARFDSMCVCSGGGIPTLNSSADAAEPFLGASSDPAHNGRSAAPLGPYSRPLRRALWWS